MMRIGPLRWHAFVPPTPTQPDRQAPQGSPSMRGVGGRWRRSALSPGTARTARHVVGAWGRPPRRGQGPRPSGRRRRCGRRRPDDPPRVSRTHGGRPPPTPSLGGPSPSDRTPEPPPPPRRHDGVGGLSFADDGQCHSGRATTGVNAAVDGVSRAAECNTSTRGWLACCDDEGCGSRRYPWSISQGRARSE